MSTALYRRYRPDTFTDVIGQEHVTAPLITALGKDAVSHAYLFSGPRGCGKTTSARILARCLNCTQGPTGQPCGECDSCRDLATGGPGSLDVIEIDAASHGGVDDARDLRERATFAPVRDRYKIFIIDEAHMVTAAGFNALLKIVEEPPEHIKFIFATTEPDKVIGTIRSRTHHYPFRLVPPEPLMDYLQRLCEQESVEVAHGVLPLVIRAGGGSVRDTLSVLDQLIAGSEDSGLDYDRAVALLGFTHATLLDDVVDSVTALDGATAFSVVDRVVQSGQDPRRFVEDLLERLRDLIIVKSVPESPGAILRGVPADQIRRMQDQATKVGAAELSRAADVTAQALTDMVGATSPRLHLELLMARLLLPHADQGTTSLAARLERLERRVDFVAGSGATPGADASATAGTATAGTAAATATESVDTSPAPEPAGIGSASQVSPSPQVPMAADAPRAEPAEPAASAEPAADAQPAAAVGPAAAHDVAPAPQPDPGVGTPGGTRVEMMRRAWPDIVQALATRSRLLWMLVKDNATVAGFDGQSLTLAFTNDGARSTFANRRGEETLNAAIQQVLGMEVSFDLITGGAPPAAGQTPKGPSRTEPAAPSEPDSRHSTPEDPTPGSSLPSDSAPPDDAAGDPTPAWVQEEGPEPDDVDPEPPQPPPSPHPAWNGEPSADPAGTAISADSPPAAPPPPAPAEESAPRSEERIPVPAFARKSAPARPTAVQPAGTSRAGAPDHREPGEALPGGRTSTLPDEAAQDSAAMNGASGRIAAIKDRMARRHLNEPPPRWDDAPPPPDPAYHEHPGGEAPPTAAPQPEAVQADAPSPDQESEDVPSADDITVEESSVFGRKAIERILGGTLLEERRMGEGSQ